MLTILREGIPCLDPAQSPRDRDVVETMLEDEVTLGPDMTQVRVQGYVWRSAPTAVVCITCSN